MNELRTAKTQEPLWIDLQQLAKPTPRRQTVDTSQGKEAEKAAPNAFLGEKTRIVERESVAPLSEGGQARPKGAKASEQSKPLAKFGVPMFDMKQTAKAPDQAEWSDFGEQFGKMQQNFVKGVKQGEVTALNTQEFVFFGYFQRIRKSLDRAWNPILRQHIVKLYRKGRHLAGEMDHVTQTLVILNKQGEIVAVKILGTSGVEDLDSAAIEAFNKAGPFPNPPEGMVGQDGFVQIRWDFILKT